MVQGQVNTDRVDRRQITILFCDLAGSSTLAARLDPEDLHAIITSFLACCRDKIHRHNGYVARYSADGIMAYFGYPEASEHDAEHAVLAGLDIISAVGSLRPREDERLQPRVGIATGEVVVGEKQGNERTAIGETPNLAARLQALAEPDAVLVAEVTQRLTSGFFEWSDLGRVSFKGFGRTIRVWRALRERSLASRFEESERLEVRAPLVDRKEEKETLLRYWKQVEAGEGQVVLLTGEPGIGKSRMIAELLGWLSGKSFAILRYYCSPHQQNTALYPIIKHIEHAAGLSHADGPQERLRKLAALVVETGLATDEVTPIIASLLSIPTIDRPLNLTARQLKVGTQNALAGWLDRLADKQSLVMAVEDLQWADPTTQELLQHLVQRVHKMPILLLITSRSEFVPPWADHHHVAKLGLQRLPQAECIQLVEGILGSGHMSRVVLDRILVHGDGVPLFLEELTRSVVQAGGHKEEKEWSTHRKSSFRVPATLHDALMARLDRLGRWKEVAQIGALLGRRFSYKMLAALVPNEEGVGEALEHLVSADIVRSEGLPPHADYTFKHALVQDVAVANLLRSRRQFLHARIARMLEDSFPEIAVREPELLAWHYMSAGLAEPAVDYYRKSAERALQRSSNVEAIDHLEIGLRLLEGLPASPWRDRRELELMTRLGAALTAAKGFAAAEVEAAYAGARSICERVEDATAVFPVLRGLWVYDLVRAEWRTAQELSEQMLALGTQENDIGYQLEGYRALGMTLLWRGELHQAREHFERGLGLYDPERHHRHAVLYGNDPGVACLVHHAYVQWMLGYPDRALARSLEAEALARQLRHPFSLTQSLIYRAFVHKLRREADQALRLAEETLRVASEHGFPFWLAEARLVRGWALAAQGDTATGLATIQQGLAEFQATGAQMDRPRWYSVHVEALRQAGQADAALDVVSEALAVVETTGERLYEPKLLELKGALLMELGDRGMVGESESCLLRALAVARDQHAKSWELRAASNLALSWARQGRLPEAVELLSPVYNWFTEGFDTFDLKNAKALLSTLPTG